MSKPRMTRGERPSSESLSEPLFNLTTGSCSCSDNTCNICKREGEVLEAWISLNTYADQCEAELATAKEQIALERKTIKALTTTSDKASDRARQYAKELAAIEADNKVLITEHQEALGHLHDAEVALEAMEIRMLRAEIAECVNCDAEGISYSDEESECSWGCRAKRKRLAELEGKPRATRSARGSEH